jgi:integrase/recombinase XerD
MTEKAISPLRRRLIEDMAIRRLDPKTQQQYIRHVKKFADFVGRSAEKATPEDVRRYQVWLASTGTTAGTANAGASALRFFFKITLKRPDLAEEVVSTREPRRLPVVLSPEEVGRLLTSATNIKHKAILSLAYATGLRSSEVVSLKVTDIDRDRMVVRVEQGKSLPPRRRGAKRIGTSFSRPSCSRYCANGGASRARRDGCLPVSPGCFPATAGSIRVRARCIGSFAWQRGVPASPNVSAFIRCGTALPPTSWSKRPTSASSRFYWDTRNSTRRRSTPASRSARSAR